MPTLIFRSLSKLNLQMKDMPIRSGVHTEGKKTWYYSLADVIINFVDLNKLEISHQPQDDFFRIPCSDASVSHRPLYSSRTTETLKVDHKPPE